MPYLLIVLCLIASILPSFARADDCANAATQADMNACADASLKNTDAELNDVYREIVGRLKGSDQTKQLLIASQRAWLLFRDAECAFSTSAAKEGSIYPSLVQNCRNSMTQDRIKGLNIYLNCKEGDLGCPAPPK
jgi:uncharacterized protein YecT (DUF1311 family)